MGAGSHRPRTSNPLRSLWMSRKLVAAAVVLGVLLWFVVINSQQVTLYFPFGLGQARSSIGVVVLLSALAGGLITGLLTAFFWAWRRYRPASARSGPDSAFEPVDPPEPTESARTSQNLLRARLSPR